MGRRDLNNLKNIQTTYGKLTIFQDKTNDNQNRIDELLNEQSEKVLKQPLNENNEFKDSDDVGDFFGIVTNEKLVRDEAYRFKVAQGIKEKISTIKLSDKREDSSSNELNFIDQVYEFDKIKESNGFSSNVTLKPATFELNENDNYIDKNFFSTNETKNSLETTKNVTVSEMAQEEDLNFFDKSLIQTKSDKMPQEMPSKIPKSDIEQKPKDKLSLKSKTDKEKLITHDKNKLKEPLKLKDQAKNDEIPLIAKEEREDDEETKETVAKKIEIKQKYKVNQEIEYPESKHDILINEIPKWYKMTIDEGAELLKKHVCHFNIEHGILAIDKPYGLPSHGGPGVHLSVAKLIPKLKEFLKIEYPLYMMNRLDENTTGVMLFATNKEAELKLREWFNKHKVIKQYLAITKNIPAQKEGEINIPLIQRIVNDKNKTYLSPNYNEYTRYLLEKPKKENPNRQEAITRYRIIDANHLTQCAILECQPQTGIKHQIRVHLAHGLNCPILGDHKYSHHLKLAPQKLHPSTLTALQIRQSKARYVPMHLHSYRIILSEWFNNKNLFINAKLPLHFLNNLKRLKLKFV